MTTWESMFLTKTTTDYDTPPLLQEKPQIAYEKKPNVKESIEAYNSKYLRHTVETIPLEYLIPAPPELNIFSTLPKDKYKRLEMKFSIMNSGLFNPIIVWKQEQGNNYMILSGHTRTEIYKEIHTEFTKYQSPDAIHFKSIPAIVYQYDELDMDKAYEIIIDTNYIQRASIDNRYMPMLVQHRTQIIQQQKDRQGKTLDIVAKELRVGRTCVYENLLLATKVDDYLAAYFYSGILTKKNVIKFAAYDIKTQFKIYRQCSAYICNASVSKLNSKMNFEQIKATLIKYKLAENVPTEKAVSFKINSNYERQFKRAVNKLIRENGYNKFD